MEERKGMYQVNTDLDDLNNETLKMRTWSSEHSWWIRRFTNWISHSCKASLVAQMVMNLPAVQRSQVLSLGQEDPLEKGMATHSNILAWRIPWTEETGGLQSTGPQRVRHNWETSLYNTLLSGRGSSTSFPFSSLHWYYGFYFWNLYLSIIFFSDLMSVIHLEGTYLV